MRQNFRPALMALLVFTLLTGVIYPLTVTSLAQVFFQQQANGDLIIHEGKVLGSELIGQYFDDPKYFWSRPSATSPYPYNASRSSGSNLAQSNPILMERIQNSLLRMKSSDVTNFLPVPIDLVTASASGLDPHISLAAAQYQIQRVAWFRGLSETSLNALVQQYTENRQFGFLGEPIVNVLKLNLALDGFK